MKIQFATHSTKAEIAEHLTKIHASLVKHDSTASAETLLRALCDTHGIAFYIDSNALKSNQHQKLDAVINGIVVASRYVTMMDLQTGIEDRKTLISAVIDFLFAQAAQSDLEN